MGGWWWVVLLAGASCQTEQRGAVEDAESASAYEQGPPREVAPEAGETHLASIRQLTFGGQNAEAYFSFESDRIIFQSTRGDLECDQIFTMGLDGSGLRLISGKVGKTTCGYFFPGGTRVLYASTHGEMGPECPVPPDYRTHGYVWKFDHYEIYSAQPDGSDLQRLTRSEGYDAECTISPDGQWIVFTSVRDGDLELYKMRADGSEATRLTHEVGYDGGAFFSPDGEWIVYRGHTPTKPEEVASYQAMLRDGLYRPSTLDLRMCRADGSDRRVLVSNGAANWAPFMHPDGRHVIFSSNVHEGPRSRNFDLFLVSIEGGEPERITFDPTFDGFPMFNADGGLLVWASNRHGQVEGETNLFLAEWRE